MAWLIGYTRRKIKVVQGLPTDITNYQMMLTIYKYGAGPDSPTQVYLGGNVRDDFRDIRFTWPDETTHISYWIESLVSGNYAVVWIRVPTNINPTHIVIYYDNPIEAVSGSNGDTTFEFFDDFTGNLSKWNNHGGASIVGGWLRINACGSGGTAWNCGVDTITNFPRKSIVELNYRIVSPNHNSMGFSDGGWIGVSNVIDSFYITPTLALTRRSGNGSGDGVSTNLNTTLVTNTIYKAKIELKNVGANYFHDSGSGYVNMGFTDTYSTAPAYIFFDVYETGITEYDNVRVRKYVSPEPTFGVSGTEELNITATDMNLDKTSCAGPCTVNVFVQWYNYGHADIESFTPAILIDGVTLAYGAPISIPSLGSAASGAIVTPTLTIGNHTICPYPN